MILCRTWPREEWNTQTSFCSHNFHFKTILSWITDLIWYKCFIRDRDELEGDTPGSTPEKAGTKNKKRCAVCKCKLELAQRTIGRCRCGKHYQVCSSVLQPCTSICSCIITCLFNKQTSFFVQFSISNVYNRIKLNGYCCILGHKTPKHT